MILAFRLDQRTDPITKAAISPCPPVLSLANWLGESRMLREGGVLDQPAGLWRACMYAAYLNQFLDRMAASDFVPKDDKENEIRKSIQAEQLKHPEWLSKH